jgi:SAM-dependent methyltransferase
VSTLARILLALVGLLVAGRVAQRAARHWAPALPAVRPRLPALPLLSAGAYSPDRLLSRLPLEPGMRVLYVGPADGPLLAAVARAAGKYGKVYAVESSPERARRLETALRRERVGNCEVVVGQPSRLQLPDSTFDLALCVGALADVPQRQRALWELHRVLRPGGHLSVSQALGGHDYLRASTLRREADAVGFGWREQQGSPLAYTANFRKAA